MNDQDRDIVYQRFVASLDKEAKLFNEREQQGWRWHDSLAPWAATSVILGVLSGPQWYWILGFVAIVYYGQMHTILREYRDARKKSKRLEKQLAQIDAARDGQ